MAVRLVMARQQIGAAVLLLALIGNSIATWQYMDQAARTKVGAYNNV